MFKVQKKFRLSSWLKSVILISYVPTVLLLIEVIVDIVMSVISALESLITIVLGLIIVLEPRITSYSIFLLLPYLCIFVES